MEAFAVARKFFVLLLASLGLVFVVPLSASAEEDLPPLRWELAVEDAEPGFFSQAAFEEAVSQGPYGWVADGRVIVVGNWNRSEGLWATPDDLAQALEDRFQCIDQRLPDRLREFVPEMVALGDFTPQAMSEVNLLEIECQEDVGLLLENQVNGSQFPIPDGQEAFFIFADLDFGACTPVVPDDSLSFCSRYVAGGSSFSVVFPAQTEPVISPIPDLSDVTAEQVGAAVAGASVLVLLVGLPSQLVGTSMENAWHIIERSRVARTLSRWKPRRQIPVPLTFGITAISAALLSSLAELGNISSVYQWFVASLIWLVTFLLMSAVGLGLIHFFARRAGHDDVKFEFHPSSLFILGFTAVGSYLAGFSPPVVFGLVFGLTFGLTFSSQVEGKMTFLGALYVLGLGGASWVSYSLWIGSGGNQDSLLAQTLSAIAIACISGLPISLLPLRLLDGRKIADWRRMAQVVAWGGSLTAFLLLAFQPGEPVWQAVDNLSAWVGAYAGFVVIALASWLVLRNMSARSRGVDEETSPTSPLPTMRNRAGSQ